MPLFRDEILLDNIKASLSLYQLALIWASTAALSGLLIAVRLWSSTPGPVPILSGEISAINAWGVAQVLCLVFGGLALSAIRRYRTSLEELSPPFEIHKAILLYPSLATLPSSFFKIGSVLLPPIATTISWIVEFRREWQHTPSQERQWGWIIGAAFLILIPYIGILGTLRALPKPNAAQRAA